LYLKEEGFDEKLNDGNTSQKALAYMGRYSSHIQILKFLKRGGQKEEMKLFWIPPVFKYLTQEKKDELWLSFDKSNVEAFWISIWTS
jgi:hypothetical protein